MQRAVLCMERSRGWWCSLCVSVKVLASYTGAGSATTLLLFQVSLLVSCSPSAWISETTAGCQNKDFSTTLTSTWFLSVTCLRAARVVLVG